MKKIGLILPLFLLSLTAMTQTKEIPLVEVDGTSEINVLPDEAHIMVTLSEKAMNVADVSNALNKKTKSIQDALKKSGVKHEFTVDNYFINVNHIYTKGSARDSGYVATQNVKVKVMNLGQDLVKVVETLHTTANMGFNVQFTISENQRKSYQKQLLVMALEDAKRKGEIIASSYGLPSIKVHRVNHTSDFGNYQPMMMRTEAMMVKSADDREEPVFNPQEQKLTDRVMVSFTFSPE